MQNAESIKININGAIVTIDVKVDATENETKNETQKMEISVTSMSIETAEAPIPKVEGEEIDKRTPIEHVFGNNNIFAHIQSNLPTNESLCGKNIHVFPRLIM